MATQPAEMPSAPPTLPQTTKPSAPAKPPSKSKPRRRVNTAEKRHQHNAIERARRETLNGKFISLARLLPSLAASRRPSKSAIVNGSIAHLTHQREQRLLAVKLLRKLAADHDALLNEVNDWRAHNGMPPKESGPAWNEQMEELCGVEKEVFGTFANFDGDEDDNDDVAENNDQVSSMSGNDMSRPVTGTAVENGLITPRSSVSGGNDSTLSAAQAMFGNMPVPEQRSAPLDWSHDFALGLATHANSANPMSFNLFSDNVDHSSTGSPANSQLGGMVMTPGTSDMNPFAQTQTPSPRSTQSMPVSGDDVKPPLVHQASLQGPRPGNTNGPQGWAASQALFFQQQQQAIQRAHEQEQNGRHSNVVSDPNFNRASEVGLAGIPCFPMSVFNNAGNVQGAGPQNANGSNGQFNNHAFTQQLFASMFPNGNMPVTSPHEQVQQWRKNTTGPMGLHQQGQGAAQMLSGAPSVDELRNAVRTGMGLGLGMANSWLDGQQNPVEGF